MAARATSTFALVLVPLFLLFVSIFFCGCDDTTRKTFIIDNPEGTPPPTDPIPPENDMLGPGQDAPGVVFEIMAVEGG